MIKSSGYRISPTEVESVILEADPVREAAVIGIPDPVLGHLIKAVVALRAGAAFQADDLLSFCAERMPRYMVPSVVEVVDDLPKNVNGKVDYALLRRRESPPRCATPRQSSRAGSGRAAASCSSAASG
jgi:acyl-CoA synthetase (AMP-forming)/AMP-acid ligase II